MEASVSNILFYTFAAASVLLALAVVTTRRILRAAVYLMGVLAVSAAFFVMLGAEFLAGIQIMVYVGGIVVLLVFAVMLTRSVELLEETPAFGRKLFGAITATAFFVTTVAILGASEFVTRKGGSSPENNTGEIGKLLLDYSSTGYVLPFEVISFLLLATVIGGIVIARKREE